MEVETYEIEEQVETETGTTPTIETEALELIESLGLEGQRGLVVPAEVESEEGRRIPYAEMNREERAVYSVLFPAKTTVTKYSTGILPVRVLQVLGHARDLFTDVQVWHRQAVGPDPILVGRLGSNYTGRFFLLARWGNALKAFPQLKEEAREKLRASWQANIDAKLAECQAFCGSLKFHVEQKLAGEYVNEPF